MSADQVMQVIQQAEARLAVGDAEAALRLLDPILEGEGRGMAVPWFARGAAQFALGDLAASRQDYLQAARLGPAQLPPATWPGVVEGVMPDDAEPPSSEDLAILADALDRAVEHSPDAAEVYLARGMFFQRQGQPENALNELDYAAELDAEQTECRTLTGDLCMALGRFFEAAESYDEAADLDPNDVQLFVKLGEACLAAGDFPRAIQAFEEGLALAPQHAAFYVGRAGAALEMDLPDDALADAKAAIEIDADSTEAWMLAGCAHLELDQPEEAVAALTRSIELSTDRQAAHLMRAGAYASLGETAAAVADYRLVLAEDPEHVEAWLGLAQTHLEAAEHDAAGQAAGEALARDPAAVGAYAVLGRVHRANDEPAKAIAVLDQGLEHAPNDAQLYLERAEARYEAGQLTLAWRDATWAMEGEEHLPEAYLLSAQIKLDADDPEGALEDVDALLELEPDDAAAYAMRGRLHALVHNWDAAFKDWRMAQSLLDDEDPLQAQLALWLSEAPLSGRRSKPRLN